MHDANCISKVKQMRYGMHGATDPQFPDSRSFKHLVSCSWSLEAHSLSGTSCPMWDLVLKRSPEWLAESRHAVILSQWYTVIQAWLEDARAKSRRIMKAQDPWRPCWSGRVGLSTVGWDLCRSHGERYPCLCGAWNRAQLVVQLSNDINESNEPIPQKTVSKRSRPLTNLSMISMISMMSLRNLENYSAVNLSAQVQPSSPRCRCVARVVSRRGDTDTGKWPPGRCMLSAEVESEDIEQSPCLIYIWNIGQTPKNINLPIRHNQAININQHQHTLQCRPVSGLFFADLVRCWKALPAVYVEHHRFPHAERQVLHKSKGRGMVWPWTIPNPFNIGKILTGGMSIFADVQPLVVENVTSSLFLVDFGLAGLATIVNSRWFKQQG